MIQLNSLSRPGMIVYRRLNAYANANKPMHPQVYQIDEIFILHTHEGGLAYITRPPITEILDLVVMTESGDIGAAFTDAAQEVWVTDAEKKTVTRHQKNSDAQILTIGDRIAGVRFLAGFELEISAVFES